MTTRTHIVPPAQIEPQQGALPLDFVPEPIRGHGLQVAHERPLVAVRLEDDSIRTVGRVSPGLAWGFPLLEWLRAEHVTAALGLDCDSDRAIGTVHDAMYDTGAALPQPNLIAVRESTGHCLAVWTFEVPVGRGPRARRNPIRLLGRVCEFFTDCTGADAGFRAVLAANPEHHDYQTTYGRVDPYQLRELAAVIPAEWRMPARLGDIRSEAGRNCTLFIRGCRWGGRLSRSDDEVAEHIRMLNRQFVHPLNAPEVDGIIRSICGHYRPMWRARAGQGTLDFRDRQAARGRRNGSDRQAEKGRRSGEVRRAGSAEETRPWDDEGVSRRTWYRSGEVDRAAAVEKTRPWLDEGISRATWYRRKQLVEGESPVPFSPAKES